MLIAKMQAWRDLVFELAGLDIAALENGGPDSAGLEVDWTLANGFWQPEVRNMLNFFSRFSQKSSNGDTNCDVNRTMHFKNAQFQTLAVVWHCINQLLWVTVLRNA